MSPPQALTDALGTARPEEYARLAAHWMTEASDLDVAPALTGNRVIDATTAASAAHVSFHRCGITPGWTREPERSLESFWYPGPDALLPNALVHSPAAFKLRGVLIEQDSLESV